MADEQDRAQNPASDDPAYAGLGPDPVAADADPAADPASAAADPEELSAPADDEVRAQESADALAEPVDETDGDGSPAVEDDDERELVAVGAPSRVRTSAAGSAAAAGGSEVATKGRAKKDKATPRQRQLASKPKRTTPAQFVREAVGELRKVVYPTGSQLANYFVVVLVFVLFIIGVVSLLDLGLGWLLLKVFA